ncbi:Homeobox-leucine zipper protein HOX14 [Acorus calamus]|uniref:Homeobox-leucine zipper protein n=1 Tax=Acorus calamus TaxID=4465 RepID=A0AAV9FL46_ACOCL|nr:Homeobox-leucine zipper protein HOX14 [Acorus calamus]
MDDMNMDIGNMEEQTLLFKELYSTFCTLRGRKNLNSGKAVHLATELGLKPKQVTVWFHNRRVSWRKKKLEEKHSKLKAGRSSIKADMEGLGSKQGSFTSKAAYIWEAKISLKAVLHVRRGS